MSDNKTEYRSVQVNLTEAERSERGKALAREVDSYTEVESTMKLEAAKYREELKAKRAKIDLLARVVDTGRETREVPCHWRAQHARGIAILVRADTSETVDTRPLTAEERQADLAFDA